MIVFSEYTNCKIPAYLYLIPFWFIFCSMPFKGATSTTVCVSASQAPALRLQTVELLAN